MKLWVCVLSLTLPLFIPRAWAADCGDTTGKDGTRVPCQCGDRVTTDTELKKTDPVVSNSPADVCAGYGLEVRSEVALDCKRLTLRGSGVGAGIYLDSVGGVTIERCTVTGFEIGIDIRDGAFSTVSRNEVSNNEVGILCEEDCIFNIFAKNTIFANTGDGLSFNDDSVENEVINNRLQDNGGDGLVVEESCIVNWLEHNVASDNDGNGISIRGGGNTLLENTGKRNGGHGLAVEGGVINAVTGNEFNRNTGHGICAIPGTIDGGGNIGKNNEAQPDVTFNGC